MNTVCERIEILKPRSHSFNISAEAFINSHVRLINLLVGILDTATARTTNSYISAAISQFIDEFLVRSSEFHIILHVLREFLPGVLAGHLRNAIEVKMRDTLLAHGSHSAHVLVHGRPLHSLRTHRLLRKLVR